MDDDFEIDFFTKVSNYLVDKLNNNFFVILDLNFYKINIDHLVLQDIFWWN